MILSKRWLSEFVELNVSDKEYSDAMTMSGSKVEGWETEGGELKNIVVGQVKSLERHPDSDHLWICAIDTGSGEPLQIVTGAQNLKEEDIVPVALHKSVIHGGQKITKGKLRGVMSNGMLCSLEELGLTAHDFPYAVEDGIFVLGGDCDRTLGLPIQEAIGLNDTMVEFEITSNRPDCLSVLGLARETAATFGVPLKRNLTIEPTAYPSENGKLSVQIHDSKKCYRYTGAVVENVRIKPSPRWMRERLRASGVRPINNIVDITNYVMLEYGQPMHAFDLRFLSGNKVNVRTAKPGETITTLDGVERTLGEDMLVIADQDKPVAVAGVMGGEYSGIMDDTTTIVFESACFNGGSVRSTAKALGMRTESSARYEKELDPATCMPALKRALELVELLDAGDLADEIVDCDKSGHTRRTLPFDPDWINRFIGIDVSAGEMRRILEAIEFRVEDGAVHIPSFRGDIIHQADVAEEIARFYGYEKIPNRDLTGVAHGKLTPEQKFERTIHSTLLACGADEITTYTFISPKSYDKIGLSKDDPLRNCVAISNPLGEDTSIMRTTALPSMLDILSRNYNTRNLDACLYECAMVYRPTGPDTLPEERKQVVIGLYGKDADFFALKGMAENLCGALRVAEYDVEAWAEHPAFHPGRTARLTIGGQELGILGEVHPAVAKQYGSGTKVYLAQLDVNTAYANRSGEGRYTPLPKYPAASRDLALVCDADIPVLTLQKAIGKAVGRNLESVTLFDVYQGDQIEAGRKSVAFSIRMRSADHTLTDAENDAAMARVIQAVEALGGALRS
ncbi:MAG: phenylalanine--tRNA ligase subunit beta [Clostridiales bacterium]|nr:phenylalanine--tRNA ligase subunit beta [Clostridiales bacterium]